MLPFPLWAPKTSLDRMAFELGLQGRWMEMRNGEGIQAEEMTGANVWVSESLTVMRKSDSRG